MEREVVIVSGCRTAIGSFGGTLKDVNGALIGAAVMKEAIKRSGIDPAMIDDVRMGCCMEPVDALNVARVSALLAGIPDTTPAVTMNRVCISGLEAVMSSAALIKAGLADIILAGGVEHMSGAPYAVPGARWGCRLQDAAFVDMLIHGLHAGSHILRDADKGPLAGNPIVEPFKGKPYIMGHTAEFVAELYGITREECDLFALRSHNNTERATREGDFKDEIVPIELPVKKGKPLQVFNKDEHFRIGLTMEQLAALPAAFIPKAGRVTAGNSSGINDGGAALILMSAQKAGELGLKPIARLRSFGRGGCHPSVMGISPVPAVKDLLKRDSKLTVKDFDYYEVNEAFASQAIACERDLGLDRERLNINGGGIGLGHPVGCTGARLIVTLLYILQKKQKSLGLATLCGGGGVSIAAAVEML